MIIQATFKNGRKINFTDNVLGLLREDKEVVEIIDLETGEVLKEAEADIV